jgi:hypothetical protein
LQLPYRIEIGLQRGIVDRLGGLVLEDQVKPGPDALAQEARVRGVVDDQEFTPIADEGGPGGGRMEPDIGRVAANATNDPVTQYGRSRRIQK